MGLFDATDVGDCDLLGWFDGACYTRNPGGTGGWGIVLKDRYDTIRKEGGVMGSGPHISNNVAEYFAVANLLELIQAIARQGWSVRIHGDSNMVIEQLSGRWGVKRARKPLYIEQHDRARRALDTLEERGVLVRFAWVPREENVEADALSTASA